jgi:hypothetical protein
MQSVRYNVITTEKFSLEFEEYNCSVPRVLSKTVLFLYDQETDIRNRETSGVVTTIKGNSPQNTYIQNRTHIPFLLCVQVLHAVQRNLRGLNGSSYVQITKYVVSLSCSECLPLVTAIILIAIMVLVLDWVYVFQTVTRYFGWYRNSDT